MSERTSAKKLSSIARAVNKKLGSDDYMSRVIDNELAGNISEWVHTGNYALDWICSGMADGSGGLPVGRIVEFFGDPSTGKSLICNHILAETQKKGGIAVLLDTEGAYMRDFGEMVGIDNSLLLEAEPDTVEDVFGTVQEICENAGDELVTIVWDSIGQTSTRHELEIGLDKPDLWKAKLIKSMFRQLQRRIGRLRVLLVATNHIYSTMNLYGKKTEEPGGRGYKFASSVRVDLVKGRNIAEDNTAVGVHVRANVVKNKIAPPFRQAEVEVYFDRGMDKYSGLLPILVERGVIEVKGSWHSFGDTKFRASGIGEIIEDHPEILKGW